MGGHYTEVRSQFVVYLSTSEGRLFLELKAESKKRLYFTVQALNLLSVTFYISSGARRGVGILAIFGLFFVSEVDFCSFDQFQIEQNTGVV